VRVIIVDLDVSDRGRGVRGARAGGGFCRSSAVVLHHGLIKLPAGGPTSHHFHRSTIYAELLLSDRGLILNGTICSIITSNLLLKQGSSALQRSSQIQMSRAYLWEDMFNVCKCGLYVSSLWMVFMCCLSNVHMYLIWYLYFYEDPSAVGLLTPDNWTDQQEPYFNTGLGDQTIVPVSPGFSKTSHQNSLLEHFGVSSATNV
jgi:hypothetical protein